VITDSRAHASHGRQVVALWLITLIGALVQVGLCSLDLPPEIGISEMLAHAPAGACWVAGADRAERTSPAQLCGLLREGLSARAVVVEHRTAGLTSIGVVPGCLLLAAWITGACAGLGSALRWAGARRALARPTGARLLIRLCVSRT
jgi:hypothetical protein